VAALGVDATNNTIDCKERQIDAVDYMPGGSSRAFSKSTKDHEGHEFSLYPS
jgi:hypothetical protein